MTTSRDVRDGIRTSLIFLEKHLPNVAHWATLMNEGRHRKITGWVTVVSTFIFDEAAAELLAPDDIEALVDYVAANPTAGIELGSGVRKLRWAIPGRGKSGGVRVIHLFADLRTPVVLLDIFAKNEKANYSPKELAEIRALAKEILAGFRGE